MTPGLPEAPQKCWSHCLQQEGLPSLAVARLLVRFLQRSFVSPPLCAPPLVISGGLMFWGCRNALRPTPAFQDHTSSNWGSLCRQAVAGPRPTHRLCPCLFPVQPSAGGSAARRGLWKSAVVCRQCLLASACGSQWGRGYRTCPCTPPPPSAFLCVVQRGRSPGRKTPCPGSVGQQRPG